MSARGRHTHLPPHRPAGQEGGAAYEEDGGSLRFLTLSQACLRRKEADNQAHQSRADSLTKAHVTKSHEAKSTAHTPSHEESDEGDGLPVDVLHDTRVWRRRGRGQGREEWCGLR